MHSTYNCLYYMLLSNTIVPSYHPIPYDCCLPLSPVAMITIVAPITRYHDYDCCLPPITLLTRYHITIVSLLSPVTIRLYIHPEPAPFLIFSATIMSASLNVLLSTIYQAIVSILSPLPYDIMLLLSPPILLTATIIFSLAMSVCLWDTEWRSTAGSRHGMFARSIMGVGMGSFYNGSRHGIVL